MLRLMNSFFKTPVAILFALWLALNPIASAAVDRLVINADPCGPMMALQKAGKNVNLLPFLQHKDGEPLLPSEYRTAPDSKFYLPADAKPDAVKTAAALRGEFAEFGAAPKGGCVQGVNCKDELEAANKEIGKLTRQRNSARDDAKECDAKLKAANEQIEKLKNSQGFAWWLLLLVPIATLAAWFLTRRQSRDQVNQLQQHNQQLQNAQDPQLMQQVTELQRQLDLAYGQIEHLQNQLHPRGPQPVNP